MSAISPVGGPSPSEVFGVVPTTAASAPPSPYLQGTLGGVAGMLSMSTQDLRGALRQGASVADLAAQKGVSRDSILQYLEQQVQQRRSAQGKPPLDQQTLDAAVNRALDRHRAGGHHHHHTAAAPSMQRTPPVTGDASSLFDQLA